MSIKHTDASESIELDDRTKRALTERMVVVPEGGDIYSVIGQHENGAYNVDIRHRRCTCPDEKHRQPAGGCKHIRRVEFATGQQPVPAGVEVDELLGEHTDSQPRFAATDGGIIDGGNKTQILDQERPDDCRCWNTGISLPCWPCYREGFDEQNPKTPAADKEENP